ARGRAALLAASRCLWSPSVLCPMPRMRLTEADRSGGIKPDHTLLWSSRVRPDTTGPACLGKPRIRGVGPRTQHPYGEKDPPNCVIGSCRWVATGAQNTLNGRRIQPPVRFGNRLLAMAFAASGSVGRVCFRGAGDVSDNTTCSPALPA